MTFTLRDRKDNESIETIKNHISIKFRLARYSLRSARVKKDGNFYKKDIELFRRHMTEAYYVAWLYLADYDFSSEEEQCMRSHITTLDAKNFTIFAEAILKSYIEDFELFEAP